jgi:hypothetical protein
VKGEAGNEDWAAEDAADKLAYEFPDEERDLAPTRLGNILLSPASYTYRQYGARLDTIWPILARKIDADFRKQIDGEMEAIIFSGHDVGPVGCGRPGTGLGPCLVRR